MSIMNSIANVSNPLGSGVDRSAYYSKKYDVVIKITHSWNRGTGEQSDSEKYLFNRLTEKEKDIFPIVGVIEHKQKGTIILMKKAEVLSSFLSKINYRAKNRDFLYDLMCDIRCYSWKNTKKNREICQSFGINPESIRPLINFSKKYYVGDLHLSNLGVIKGNLVILDAGF